eukprot:2671116-Pyramimonas_sp.AAC.1
MLDDEEGDQLFRLMWFKYIWDVLLKPLCLDAKLPRTYSERYAMTYGFGIDTLHPDASPEADAHDEWEHMRNDKRIERALPLTSNQSIVV